MIKEALATHQRKLEFLRKRIKEGVSKTLPDEPRMTSSESWSRQRKVGFRYAFQGESTLTKLGKAYGITTERASQLNEKFLPNIWHTASRRVTGRISFRNASFSKAPCSKVTRRKL